MTTMWKISTEPDRFVVFQDRIDAEMQLDKLRTEGGCPNATIEEIEMTPGKFDELEPVDSWQDYW